MTTTGNSNNTETTHSLAARLYGQGDGQEDINFPQAPQGQADPGQETAAANTGRGKPESELRAAARRRGLTVKQLASLMGVDYGYLCSVASGRRPWSPMLRERAMAVLGEVPGQGIVYRQGGLVRGESTSVRERARERGLSLKALAELVGVSAGYLSDVCRGRRNMSRAPRNAA